MAKGLPRFFCEHCGAEVPRSASRCSRCGRLFSDIRCPACGFSGPEGKFASGCPSCGYSAPRSRKDDRTHEKGGGDNTESAGSLPLWVYALTLLALALVAVFLFLPLVFP